jgi:peroxiredoxin
MVTTLCLLTCALVTAQPAARPEWLLSPHLTRGQELVYGGTFEECIGLGVQCRRAYRLDSTIFILDGNQRGFDAALLTIFEMRALRQDRAKEARSPRSVRLEVAHVSPRGRVEGTGGAALLVPLEGPPTVEHGALVELPQFRIGPGDMWDVAEPGRPPRHWRVVGTESINNTSCLKLIGEQRSESWDAGRADRSTWRRRDTVWIAPAVGVAYRVERVIERRDAARTESSYRAVARYDLLSRLTYPGSLFRDREREIWQARRFLVEAEPFLRKPAQQEEQLNSIWKRIESYQDRQPPVEPYCKAIQHLKQRVEAAKRGEAAPEPVSDEASASPTAAAIGQKAPDFVATDYIKQQSMRLHRLLGRPILLIFYNPNSPTAREILRFANDKQRLGVAVLGLAVTSDANAVRKQHADLRLTFPVAAGDGFKVTYGVDATPRIILLDKDGTVRGAYTGWGTPTPGEINEELSRWLP